MMCFDLSTGGVVFSSLFCSPLLADHTINLALLDRILADPKFTVSPRAQEALTRIAALRAGQGSTDPNEWVALLRSSGSYPDNSGVSSNRGDAK